MDEPGMTATQATGEPATTDRTATGTPKPEPFSEVVADWSRWRAAAGTAVETSDEFYRGGTSLKLSDEEGSAVRIVNDDIPVTDLSQMSFCAAVKWVSPDTGVAFRIILHDEAGNRLSAQTNVPSRGDDGWMVCEFGINQEIDGEPVDLTRVAEIAFVFFNGADLSTEVYVDDLQFVPYKTPRGAVVLTADDGHETQITQMHSILQEYGHPATYFIISTYIGTNSSASRTSLDTLVKSGSHVSGHPQRSTSLPAMSDEEQRATIQEEYEYISEEFGEEHARYMSFPYSERDAGTVADAKEFHDLCFIGANGTTAGFQSAAPYSVIRASFDSLDELLGALEIAERYDRVLIPQFHTFFQEQETGGLNINPDDFRTFLNEIETREVDVFSISEFHERRDNE